MAKDTVFDRIILLLDAHGVVYRVMDHAPVYTSEEAARVRGTRLDQGAKAMIMKADGRHILLVLASHLRVDTRRFKASYKVKDLRLISPEEVESLVGLKVGSVPPFGNVMGLPTYVDRSLLQNETIAFNAGLHTRSVVMPCKDYITLAVPEIGDFSSGA